MAENLRLALASSTKLTTDDTDVLSAYIPNSTQLSGHSVSTEWGGFYNWTLATAGTGGASGNAPSSICAQNWKLPSKIQFEAQYSTYGVENTAAGLAIMRGEPLRYVFSGNSAGWQNSRGFYWSSTSENGTYARRAVIRNEFPWAQIDTETKTTSFSVRCIAK